MVFVFLKIKLKYEIMKTAEIKEILGWLVSLPLLLIGILWIKYGGLWIEYNMFLGILHIILFIFIFPINKTLIEKIIKKKKHPFLSWFFIIVGFLLIFYSFYKFDKVTNEKGEFYYNLAIENLVKQNLDTVPYFIEKAKKYYTNNANNSAIDLEEELKKYNDSIFLKNVLMDMSNEEYELLINRDLTVKYFNYLTLNDMFYDKLYSISIKRNFLIEQRRIENEQKQKIKEQKEREKLILSQFDYGRHIPLEVFIKNNMNDPKSFQHIETRYKDENTHLLVTVRFRGNNAFGAKIINTVTAKVDFKGNVLQIVSQK